MQPSGVRGPPTRDRHRSSEYRLGDPLGAVDAGVAAFDHLDVVEYTVKIRVRGRVVDARQFLDGPVVEVCRHDARFDEHYFDGSIREFL